MLAGFLLAKDCGMAPESHCGNCFSRTGESASAVILLVVVPVDGAQVLMAVMQRAPVVWPTCRQAYGDGRSVADVPRVWVT